MEAAQLEESRLTTLETTFDASLRAGLHDAITGELEELTVEYPFRERFYDLLMVAFYRCGRQAEALGVYERARARLSYELGVNPGPALVNRVREVLSHSPELDSPPPPAPVVDTPPVLAARAVGGHDRLVRHRGGVDLGDELVELHHRLDRLGREQELLSRRLEQLTALAAAGGPAVLRPAV